MATKTSGHKHPITGTARMLCRAGSRHLSSVRPSVRPSVCPGRAHSSKPAAAGVLLWARSVKKHKTLKTYFCHPWFGVESLVDPRNRVVGTQIPRAKGAIFLGGGRSPYDAALRVRCCGPGPQEISIGCCRALSSAACGGRMRAVPRSQRTYEAEHGLLVYTW